MSFLQTNGKGVKNDLYQEATENDDRPNVPLIFLIRTCTKATA